MAGSPSFIFAGLFVAALCAMLVIGVIVPRSLSFLPPVIGLLGYLGHWFVQKQRPALSKPAAAIAALIFVLVLLSSFWSIDFEISIERCLKMLPVFFGGVLLISAVQAQGDFFVKTFAKFFAFAVVFAFALNAFEMLSMGMIHSYIRDTEHIFTKNLSHLNRSVVISTLCIFPLLAIIKNPPENCKYRLLVYVAILSICIVTVFALTDSQSVHLAFALGFLFYLFFPVEHRFAWKILQVFMILLILATPWLAQYLFAALPPLIEKMHWFQTSYAMDRLEIWDFVSRYALESPVLGHGVEATRAVEAFETKMLYHKSLNVLHPHNFSVQFWVEFGALGAVVLCALMIYLLSAMQTDNPLKSRMYLASFMAFMCVAAIGYGFWQGWHLGLMIMIAVYAMIMGRYLDRSTNK